MRYDQRNTKLTNINKNFVKYDFVFLLHQFLPILILLFKHFRKFEEVQKLLYENLS
jgi:hypothetical protein